MRRHGQGASPFRVGLLVIVIMMAASYLAYAKRWPWANDWQVSAMVSEAQELAKGAPVRIAGVNVGKVASVRRGPAGTAIVTMNVQASGRPLHRDATLTIRPRLFLEGNFFVDVRPGSPSAPQLNEGDTIPLAQTATAVRIDSVLRILNSDIRGKLQDGIREYSAGLSHGGAAGLNRAFPVAEPALLGLARTASALRGERHDDLPTVLRESGRLASGLARNEAALGGLVSGFARTVKATAAHQQALGESISEFNLLASQAPPALVALTRALPSVQRLAVDLRPPLRAAPGALDASRPFLKQVSGLVQPAELTGLERDLSPALRQLQALAPPLTGLLGKVGRVSSCVSDHVVPVLQTTVDDGDLSSGVPVWQDLVRATVGINSAGQNFDGDGPDLRFSLSEGDQTLSLGRGPSTGDLFARGPRPLIGSRPQMPPALPPLRPDVPCHGQTVPSLKTDVLPTPTAPPTAAPTLSGKQGRSLRALVNGKRR
jgi:ABC-type transporter Mla subunit MlaD